MAEDLRIRITAATADAERSIKRVADALRDVGRAGEQVGTKVSVALAATKVTAWAERVSGSLKRVEERLSSLSSKLGQLSAIWGAVIVGTGVAALRFGMQLERLELQFRIMTGSAEKAALMLEAVRRISQTSVFDFSTLAEAAAKLGNTIAAVGGDVTQTIPLLDRIQKLAVAFGETTPVALEGIVRAFTQIIAKGRVTSEELLQLSERNIPAMSLLAKEMKLTSDQIAKIGELGISAAQGINAIFSAVERQGILKRASEVKTFAAAFSTLRQTVVEMVGSVGKAIGERIMPLLWQLIGQLESLRGSKAFEDFAQSVANAVATLIKGLIWLVEQIKVVVNWFAKLPPSIQNALSLLFVGGPLIGGAVAGLMKIGSLVTWLTRTISVDLIAAIERAIAHFAALRAAAEAAKVAGAGAGAAGAGAGVGVAAGVGAGAGAVARARLGAWGIGAIVTGVVAGTALMTQRALRLRHLERVTEAVVTGKPPEGWSTEVVRKAHEIAVKELAKLGLSPEQQIKAIRAFIAQSMGVALTPELAAVAPTGKKIVDIASKAWEKAKQEVMGERGIREVITAADKAIKAWEEKFRKQGLQLPQAPRGQEDQRRRKERLQALKEETANLQAQLSLVQEQLKLAEARFENLLKQGRIQEAIALKDTEIKGLLQKQSDLQVKLKATEMARQGIKGAHVLAILRESEALEQQRKLNEFSRQIEEARRKEAEKRKEAWEKEGRLLRQELEAMIEDWRKLSDEQKASEANLLPILRKLAEAEKYAAGLAENERERALILREFGQIQAALMKEQQEAAERTAQTAEKAAQAVAMLRGAMVTAPLGIALQELSQRMPLLEAFFERLRVITEALSDAQKAQRETWKPLLEIAQRYYAVRQAVAFLEGDIVDMLKAQWAWLDLQRSVQESIREAARKRWQEEARQIEETYEIWRTNFELIWQEWQRTPPETRVIPQVPTIGKVKPLPSLLDVEREQRLLEIARELGEITPKQAQRGMEGLLQLEERVLTARLKSLQLQIKATREQEEQQRLLKETEEILTRLRKVREERERLRPTVEPVEKFVAQLPQVLSGRATLGQVVSDFVKDMQEHLAKELLKPITEALRKALSNLANQLSSAIAGLVAKLPQSIQLGLGGLALFGGLRPITEAIEGVGKFITHTVGEVLKVFGIRIGGKKKASPPAVIPLGAAVYGPSINLSTAVTLQVDGRELGRVLVRQAV